MGWGFFLIYEKWPRENKNLKSSPDCGHENKRVLGKKLKSEHSKCCAAIEEKGPLTFKIVIKKCAESFKKLPQPFEDAPFTSSWKFRLNLKNQNRDHKKNLFQKPQTLIFPTAPPKTESGSRFWLSLSFFKNQNPTPNKIPSQSSFWFLIFGHPSKTSPPLTLFKSCWLVVSKINIYNHLHSSFI